MYTSEAIPKGWLRCFIRLHCIAIYCETIDITADCLFLPTSRAI